MKNLFFIPAAGVLSLSLAVSGCTYEQVANDIKAGTAVSLPAICAAGQEADAVFKSVASVNTLPAKVLSDERAAIAGLDTLCSGPSKLTPSQLLAKATAVYITVNKALKAVQGN
jgi:hypothetical protein